MREEKSPKKMAFNISDGTAFYSLVSTACYFATSYWTNDSLNIPATLVSILLATLVRFKVGTSKIEIDRDLPIFLGVLGVRGVARALTDVTGLSPALSILTSQAIVLAGSYYGVSAAAEDDSTPHAKLN